MDEGDAVELLELLRELLLDDDGDGIDGDEELLDDEEDGMGIGIELEELDD